MRQNSHGIIRALRRVEKNSTQETNEKKGGSGNFISFLALIISIVALYFQFFYYHYDLNASFISGGYENDSLRLHIIYHNKGNQDGTILKAEVWYFSDSNVERPKNHLGFRSKLNDPVILPPGSQEFHIISEPTDFKIFDFEKNNTNPFDTLRIQLQFRYLNDYNLLSEKEEIVGWVTLDSNKQVDYYSLSFKNIILETDTYISETYRSK
ncbi:hypothetical protein GCM10009118_19990 [Wandonia haliotis]|uniref:Uncharacterized protein n=1 Tax=Wandonia haliotis TaxID=574963 RepID=A0ABN1MQJ8_9FLAO